MTKRKEAKYTFKVYKKGENTPFTTRSITAYSSEKATNQLKYKYWEKYGKDIVNLELISSTRLQEWCLFYIVPDGESCIEHHLYTKAFSLKEAKKHFKSIIERIPKDSGYFLYAYKELRKIKK